MNQSKLRNSLNLVSKLLHPFHLGLYHIYDMRIADFNVIRSLLKNLIIWHPT